MSEASIDTAVSRAKAELRVAMVTRIRSLAEQERRGAAERAALALDTFLSDHAPAGALVALYAATSTELSSAPAVRRLSERYRLAFPRVAGASLTFHEAPYAGLTAHQSRVREPLSTDPLVIPDVIVVPARAYDRSGLRLGHGYGFYDHAFAELPDKTLRIGLCHDFQVVDRLPRAPHDQGVEWLVTDTGTPYRCHAGPDSDTMPPARQDGT